MKPTQADHVAGLIRAGKRHRAADERADAARARRVERNQNRGARKAKELAERSATGRGNLP